MGKRKVLFFDIDETLLSHKTFAIPESTKNALRKAKENGHLIFINTGRTKSLIGDDIKELGFDGYVCGCGTYIEVNNKVLYNNIVNKENYNAILKGLKKYKLNCVLEGEEAIYVDENAEDDFLLSNLRKQNYPVEPYDLENMKFNKMFIRYDDNKYIDSLIGLSFIFVIFPVIPFSTDRISHIFIFLCLHRLRNLSVESPEILIIIYVTIRCLVFNICLKSTFKIH